MDVYVHLLPDDVGEAPEVFLAHAVNGEGLGQNTSDDAATDLPGIRQGGSL